MVEKLSRSNTVSCKNTSWRRWWPTLALMIGVLASAPIFAQNEDESESPLLTPREFHERECRLRHAALAAEWPRVTVSTQDDYDVLFYDLALDLRGFYNHRISGTVRILARSLADDLDEMVLDLCDSLTVDSVVCGGSARPFTLSRMVLTVSLDRTYLQDELVDVSVTYHGTPCFSNVFPTVMFYLRPLGTGAVPSLSTMSEPYGARDWWPCKNVPGDKADSARIALTVADTLTATSNGVLESVTNVPVSSRVYTWVEHHPIAPYLITACATNYAHYRDWYVSEGGDSLPLDFYVYPERLSRAQTSWSGLPQMMTILARRFGPFPFMDEKYGHTMFNLYGTAMEHQCNTSFSRSLTDGQHTYDYIVLHEAAHQWWGDEVTLDTWANMWLNEGFASYSEALWQEAMGGFAAYHSYLLSPDGLDVVDPSGPVYNPGYLFDANTVYDKGAWILHMLRGVVRNDSQFFAALAQYRARHAGGNATTQEFLSDMTDALGHDVTPYLYAYLYRKNRPVYAVSSGSGRVHDGWRSVVRIRQVQSDPDTLFRTRLDLCFTTDADTSVVTVENAQSEERHYVSTSFLPEHLLIDPNDWVLKQVSFEDLPLTILTNEIPPARIGVVYEDTLIAVGGVDEVVFWGIDEGRLPAGLVLTADGILAGMTQESGDFRFLVHVHDQNLGMDTLWLDLRVNGNLESPTELTAYLKSDWLIELRWQSVAEADSYRVFRASRYDLTDMTWIATTTDTVLCDSVAEGNGSPDFLLHRFYVVTAVDEP